MVALETLYALSVVALMLLASTGAGMLCLRPLRRDEAPTVLVWIATTLGLGLLSVGTLLLGLAGLLYLWLFALLLVPLAAVGVWALFQHAKLWKPTQSNKRSWSFVLFASACFALIATTVVWITATHALMPPHEWDEIAYHLALAKLYVENHNIFYVPYNVTSNWPLNNEMLFVVALLFRSELATHLIMLAVTVLIAAGLVVISQHYLDTRVGLLAAALFITIPLVKRLSGTGMIDVALGLYVLAALFAFLRWQEKRQLLWLVVCGSFCGFVAGSKLMGGAFPLVFGLLVVWTALRQQPRDIPSMLRAGIVFGCVGLVFAGPWYLRSLVFTGNPIWPFAYHTFGGRNWDALGDEYHMHLLIDVWTISIPRTPLGLLQSVIDVIQRPDLLGGYRGGLGEAVTIGGLLAAVLAWRSPPIVRYSIGISGAFYVLWFVLVSHQVRYLLPIAPLLALATAHAVFWLHDRLPVRALQAAFLVAVLALMTVRFWPWADQGERDLLAARVPYLRGEVSRAAWLDSQVSSMPLFRYANAELPLNASILLLPYENRSYYLDRESVWGSPIAQRLIRFEQFQSAPELAMALHGLGITHVIDAPTWVYEGIRYWQQDRALMLALRDQCGEIVYRQGDSVVYALRECTLPN